MRKVERYTPMWNIEINMPAPANKPLVLLGGISVPLLFRYRASGQDLRQ